MIDEAVMIHQEARARDKDDRQALGLLLAYVSSEASRLGLDEVSRMALVASRQCRGKPDSH